MFEIMNVKRSGKLTSFSLSCLFVSLTLAPVAFASPGSETETASPEASPSDAQATMASLFSRGAKMPGIPQIAGTIALPSFDSSELKIDTAALDAGQRQGTRDWRLETRD